MLSMICDLIEYSSLSRLPACTISIWVYSHDHLSQAVVVGDRKPAGPPSSFVSYSPLHLSSELRTWSWFEV
jgi:hypothetical protein